MIPSQLEVARPERAWIQGIRDELTRYYGEVRGFSRLGPGEVLLKIAGISARLCELRAELIRSDDRIGQRVRTGEVDPLIDALKFQFQIWSRLVSVRKDEYEMSNV